MTFRVGQKVVCIKDGWSKAYGTETPIKGRVYTIREVVDYAFFGGTGLRLAEIVNPPHPYMEGFAECSFSVGGFRPLVERKTDITFAHEIVRKVFDGVRA